MKRFLPITFVLFFWISIFAQESVKIGQPAAMQEAPQAGDGFFELRQPPGPPPDPPFTGCAEGNEDVPVFNAAWEQEVVDLVNVARADSGRPPLKLNADLTRAARYHSMDMGIDDYFAHDSYDAGNPDPVCIWYDRIRNFYGQITSVAENIAAGHTSPQAVMTDWMNSSGHRANILHASLREIGVGFYEGSGTYYRYWTQDFGADNTVYPVVINSDSAETDSRNVRLYIYGSWTQIRIRNDGGTWSSWMAFTSNWVDWALTNLNGLRTVDVEMTDGVNTFSSSDQIYFTGATALQADFSADRVFGYVPQIIHFTDLSTGEINTYSWTFGDGGSSASQNPTHTYTSTGTFTVSLTVSGPGGSDTETKTNYITINDPGGVDYYAVIVGIADYPGTLNDLDYTDDDAYDIYDALVARPEWDAANVQLLLDGQASKQGVINAINAMKNASDGNDVCLFSYSGHGSFLDDASPYDESDFYDETLYLYDQHLRDDEFGDLFADLFTDKLTVILDACYSGGTIKALNDDFRIKTVNTTGIVVGEGDGFADDFYRMTTKDLDDNGFGVVLAACDDDELSAESSALQNGVFTYYVVQGMMQPETDTDSNDWISAEEIYAYANPLATAYRPLQHAQIYDGYSGNLDLLSYSEIHDVTLDDFWFNDDPITVDQDFTLYLQVTNNGNYTEDVTSMTYIWSGPKALRQPPVPSVLIDPGQTLILLATIHTPVSAGVYDLGVTITPVPDETNTADNSRTEEIDVTTGVIDEEFVTGSAYGYTEYIPKAGPDFNLLVNDGYNTLTIPSGSVYDHWLTVDDMPQWLRPLTMNDWGIETKVQVTTAPGDKFQTGLMVYFSQYDIYYWGFDSDLTSIKLRRTGILNILEATYNGGNEVELRIKKQGNTYTFQYRAPGAPVWIDAGTHTTADVPSHVGLFGKTWAANALEARFDYLRMTDGSDPLAVTTTSLPNGIINTAYSAQLEAAGGTPGYTWSMYAGSSLPAGLSLSAAGQISGVPTATGTTPVIVQVTDSATPAATDTAHLFITITDQLTLDEEFDQGHLFGYDQHIPKAGPTFSATSRSGWLRMTVPNTSTYDHWITKDEAPQLWRDPQGADWTIETLVEMTTAPSNYFHAGLVVNFSQYDCIVWGFFKNISTLEMNRSGTVGMINLGYAGGNSVELRVRKVGTTYYFDYRAAGAGSWIQAGSTTATQTPLHVGVIGKTWSAVNVVADFDYLRMNAGSGPLDIVTTNLPAGTVNTAYTAQLLATGGTPGYTWSMYTGSSLPAGLSLSAAGQISGVPTATGTTPVIVQVTDSATPAAVDTAHLSITINAQPTLDEEFTEGHLNGYDQHIPKAGPTFSATSRSGWLRMTVPNTSTYDHWTTKDEAPQLWRDPQGADWTIETLVEMTTAPSNYFHAGLVVNFSQYDCIVWGFFKNISTLEMNRSGTVGMINLGYAGGNSVELRVRKVGTTYYFDYRAAGAGSWIQAGSTTATQTPLHVGVIGKTWSAVNVVADFDYLRMNAGSGPLDIVTTGLPPGTVNTAYTAQLSAAGGTPGYTWSMYTGSSLPAGLSLSAAGQISGVPTATGTTPVIVQVTDSATPAATDTAHLSITITDQLTLDEEFTEGHLNGYDQHIPKAGPTFSATSRSGWLRMTVPNTSTYDQWTTKDEAPQLWRDPQGTDWTLETLLEMTTAPSNYYHVGLVIYFSQFDCIYWGYSESLSTLKMSRSGNHGMIVVNYAGGNSVELRMRKVGTTYYFDYRTAGAGSWIQAGSTTATQTPLHVGVIGKTWKTVNVVADFDYLRMNAGSGPLDIVTMGLPSGTVNTAYTAQLQATGGTPGYTWSMYTGSSLPAGLSLSAAGQISGVPTATGTTPVIVQVTDSATPAAVDTAHLSITINAQPTLDEEFTEGHLNGYDQHIPKAGPTFSAASRSGWLRMTVPNTSTYDHWTTKDEAPQLWRDPQGADWTIETLVEMTTAPSKDFHAGLVVNFSQYDCIVWGFFKNISTLEMNRSGTVGMINLGYTGGNSVELRVRKVGTTYYFDYRTAGAGSWIQAGSTTATQTPLHVGVIGKTWSAVNVVADFDYLRMNAGSGSLDIVTTNLPAGTVNTAYTAQLSATGGTPGYTWSMYTGSSLPAGLNLSAAGQISGVPTATGTTPVIVQVTDSATPAAVDTAHLSITINAQPTLDEEFTEGHLNGYDQHIPKAGPTFSAASRSGWLRMTVPNSTKYDQWTSKDEAPQLWRDPQGTNWTLETLVEMTTAPSNYFHAGLVVNFSQYDCIVWGFFKNISTLEMNRSGTLGLINLNYTGGNSVELRIRKVGTTYYFDYRAAGAGSWIAAGSTTATETPLHIGVIGKTWGYVNVVADFDYLRLTTQAGVVDLAQNGDVQVEKLPEEFSISQCYPNPFNPQTQLTLALTEAQHVQASVYNITGQKVKSLLNRDFSAGNHHIVWNATDDMGTIVNTGTYFMVIRVNGEVYYRKLLLLK